MKKREIIFVIVLLLVTIFAGMYLFNITTEQKQKIASINQPEEEKLEYIDANTQAAVEAKVWRQDAELAYMKSLSETNSLGEANDWILIFTSSSTAGRGFEVIIKNKEIVDSKETDFFGTGDSLIPKDLISAEEAIAKMREIKGKENLEVLGTELIWNEAASAWYWGIKTAQSIISIKASK